MAKEKKLEKENIKTVSNPLQKIELYSPSYSIGDIVKIIDIRKKEHFGIVYGFFNPTNEFNNLLPKINWIGNAQDLPEIIFPIHSSFSHPEIISKSK